MHTFGRDYVAWERAGASELLKPGRRTVRTALHVVEAVQDELGGEAANGEKVLRWFSNDVIDASGEVVARVRKQVYVRLKPQARGAP